MKVALSPSPSRSGGSGTVSVLSSPSTKGVITASSVLSVEGGIADSSQVASIVFGLYHDFCWLVLCGFLIVEWKE